MNWVKNAEMPAFYPDESQRSQNSQLLQESAKKYNPDICNAPKTMLLGSNKYPGCIFAVILHKFHKHIQKP